MLFYFYKNIMYLFSNHRIKCNLLIMSLQQNVNNVNNVIQTWNNDFSSNCDLINMCK